ncbi:MAG TPA: hypothetical protein VK469_18460 [Candidatus Kapabacteria bacterium]|nr:hypothetical protein [Candidatus Kapabacteria bacterium]
MQQNKKFIFFFPQKATRSNINAKQLNLPGPLNCENRHCLFPHVNVTIRGTGGASNITAAGINIKQLFCLVIYLSPTYLFLLEKQIDRWVYQLYGLTEE